MKPSSDPVPFERLLGNQPLCYLGQNRHVFSSPFHFDLARRSELDVFYLAQSQARLVRGRISGLTYAGLGLLEKRAIFRLKGTGEVGGWGVVGDVRRFCASEQPTLSLKTLLHHSVEDWPK